MEVVICPDSGAASVLVADAIERLLRRTPDAVLGLATGSSPLGVYDELARRVQAGTLTLCYQSGAPTEARQIVISAVGRPRIQKTTVNSCA